MKRSAGSKPYGLRAREAVRDVLLFMPHLLLFVAPLLGWDWLVPILSFVSTISIVAHSFLSFGADGNSQVSWQMCIPHLLLNASIWSATLRRVSIALSDEGNLMAYEEIIAACCIPIMQASAFSIGTVMLLRQLVGPWSAVRWMLASSGAIGSVGNVALRLVMGADPQIRYTPGGCTFFASVVVWMSMLLFATSCGQISRRVIAFLLASTPLKGLSEAHLHLLSTNEDDSRPALLMRRSRSPVPRGSSAKDVAQSTRPQRTSAPMSLQRSRARSRTGTQGTVTQGTFLDCRSCSSAAGH